MGSTLEYEVEERHLTRIKMTRGIRQVLCQLCEEKIKVGQRIVRSKRNGANGCKTKHYHKLCAKQINLI